MADKPDGKPNSDIVELIIAVDLDPSNPEEPINVSSVDKSEGLGKGKCPMCARLFKAIAKMEPEYSAIVKDTMDDEAKIAAIEKLAETDKSEDQDEASAFDKAMAKPGRTPEQRYGHPKPPAVEKPSFEDKPRFEDRGDSWDKSSEFEPRPKKRSFDDEGGDFQPKKKFGGFRGASDRAFGRKERQDPEDFKDHGADEDTEDEYGNRKKEW